MGEAKKNGTVGAATTRPQRLRPDCPRHLVGLALLVSLSVERASIAGALSSAQSQALSLVVFYGAPLRASVMARLRVRFGQTALERALEKKLINRQTLRFLDAAASNPLEIDPDVRGLMQPKLQSTPGYRDVERFLFQTRTRDLAWALQDAPRVLNAVFRHTRRSAVDGALWIPLRSDQVFAIRSPGWPLFKDIERLSELQPGERGDLIGPFAGFRSIGEAGAMLSAIELAIRRSSRATRGEPWRRSESFTGERANGASQILEVQYRPGERIVEHAVGEWNFLVFGGGSFERGVDGEYGACYRHPSPLGHFPMLETRTDHQWPVLRVAR